MHTMAYMSEVNRKYFKENLEFLNEDPISNENAIRELESSIKLIDNHSDLLQHIFNFFANKENKDKFIFYKFDVENKCEILSYQKLQEYDVDLLKSNK
jgi:hypothetical protein